MKIRISEVWNASGRSVDLATIEVKNVGVATLSVQNWIKNNRPDLGLADTIFAHGYHAIAI